MRASWVKMQHCWSPQCHCDSRFGSLAHLGPILVQLGTNFARLGSIFPQLGFNLAPTWPHLGSTWAHLGGPGSPKTCENLRFLYVFATSPLWSQDGPKMAPRRLQDRAKTPPSRFQVAFKFHLILAALQNLPRCPQDGPRAPPGSPKRPPRSLQEAPRSHKKPQETPKRPPRGPQEVPLIPVGEHFGTHAIPC